MKLLTASLEGKALDWALAKARGADDVWVRDGAAFYRNGLEVCAKFGHAYYEPFSYKDHSVCLGLIEQMSLDVNHRDPLRLDNSVLVSWGDKDDFAYGYWSAHGKTLAEAVARCVVAMQLGGEVDVPDELCEQRKEGA